MAKSKHEELKEKRYRNEYFSNFIKDISRRDKIKHALLEEYKKGNFYSVPPNLFRHYEPKDMAELKRLRKIYLLSKIDKQAIPEGLFDLEKPEERNLLFRSFAQKLNAGISIDFSFIPDAPYTKNEITMLDRFKNYSKKMQELSRRQQLDAKKGFGKNGSNRIINQKNDINSISELMGVYGNLPNITNEGGYAKNDEHGYDLNFFQLLYENQGYTRKLKTLGFIKDKSRDSNEELTIADINKELKKALRGKTDYFTDVYEIYESLFLDLYEMDFKRIELDATYMSNDQLNSILKQQFYKFSANDGIIEGAQTERQLKSLSKQREFIKSVLVSLARTGCLSELIRIENRNLKSLNELLTEESQFEELDEAMVFEDLEFLNIEKQEDIINLYTFGRHFTNKLAHNYIDYAYAILKMNSISDREYELVRENEFDLYLKGVYEILGDGTNIDVKALDKTLAEMIPDEKDRKQRIDILMKILKNGQDKQAALKKARSNIKGKLESSDCFEKNRICRYENITDYFYSTINTLKNMQKQYYDTVRENTGNSRVSSESFEEIFGQVLDGTIKKENFTEFKRTETVKRGKTKTVYLMDEMQEFVDRFRDGFFTRPADDVLKRLVGTLEKVEEIFSAKQFFTEALIVLAEKRPELIRLEHLREIDEDTNTGGVFDVILPGRIQVFGGHYKEGEFDQTDSRITSLPPANEDVSACFSTDDKKAGSLNVFVPLINNLTNEQIQEFKALLTTINHLDSDLALTEEQSKTLQGYDKLKALKASSPESYESMKVRIALGAGIDEYKKMYAVELQQAASKEKQDESTNAICTLTTFQKSTANLIISEISSGRSMQDVINDIGTVNAAILEYVQTKIKEESFYQAQPDEIKAELLKLETDREYETGEQKE